jgi:FixJ family two-component response regulator
MVNFTSRRSRDRHVVDVTSMSLRVASARCPLNVDNLSSPGSGRCERRSGRERKACAVAMRGYLTVKEIAAQLGVKPETVRTYHAKRKQRYGMPPADEHVGRTPVWREETINAWIRRRRGQGWRKGATSEHTHRRGSG